MTRATKLLIVIALTAIAGIILRWDYVSTEVVGALGRLFD